MEHRGISRPRDGQLNPGQWTPARRQWHGQAVYQPEVFELGGDGQTTLTVTFTDFGQPQSITAPATSNPVPASP
jgi:hypothetical protein